MLITWTLIGIFQIVCCSVAYSNSVTPVTNKDAEVVLRKNASVLNPNDPLRHILDKYSTKSKYVQKSLSRKIGTMEKMLRYIQDIEESIPKLSADLKALQQKRKAEKGDQSEGTMAVLAKINDWLDLLENTLKSKGSKLPLGNLVGDDGGRGRSKRSPRRRSNRASEEYDEDTDEAESFDASERDADAEDEEDAEEEAKETRRRRRRRRRGGNKSRRKYARRW